MRAPFHRLLSLGVLLLWTAPSLGATSAALHIALDHHRAHQDEHAEGVAELLRAATHGHHHDLEAPEHEHEASLGTTLLLPRPVAAVEGTPPPNPFLIGQEARSRLEPRSRRGPPTTLFTAHCSLLL